MHQLLSGEALLLLSTNYVFINASNSEIVFLVYLYMWFVFIFCVSPHGGQSTAGDFDSEVDSTVSSRRGSRRREKHGINRNEGK